MLQRFDQSQDIPRICRTIGHSGTQSLHIIDKAQMLTQFVLRNKVIIQIFNSIQTPVNHRCINQRVFNPFF